MTDDKLFAKVLATRTIANINEDLAKMLKLPGDHRCIALITADMDDVTYTALDEATKAAVQLVTKTASYRRPDDTGEAEYYARIAEHDIAIMVKILDRVNNISAMAGGFTREKMLSYIVETEELIYPLIDKAKKTWNKYEHPVFLIEYQMKTMIESLKRVL